MVSYTPREFGREGRTSQCPFYAELADRGTGA